MARRVRVPFLTSMSRWVARTTESDMNDKASNVEALVEASARRGAADGARAALAEHVAPHRKPPLLTVSEAAAYLKIHPDTLRRWISDEEAPALPVGGEWRFDLAALEAWLKSRGVGRRGRRGGAR